MQIFWLIGSKKEAYANHFCHINWSALKRFPPLGKSYLFIKNYDNIFNYLPTRHTLYLAIWIFETWRFLVIVFSFPAFVHEISSWTLEEKFHTSALPSIILYLFLYFLTSICYQCNDDFMKRAIQTSSTSLLYIMQNTIVENSTLNSVPFSYLEFKIQKYKGLLRKRKKITESERCFACTLELNWSIEKLITAA